MREDIKYALRSLRNAPGFSFTVIVTLALGLGANTAVFSVIHAALLAPLPYHQPHRLVRVALERGGEHRYFPGAGLIDLRANSRTFDVASVYTYAEQGVDLIDAGRPERVASTQVSANYFAVMGVQPLMGRVFRSDEERPDARVAVISERLWREYFDAGPDAVGRSLRMSGVPVTVVGVVPGWYEDPFLPDVEVFVPENLQPDGTNTWGNNRLSAVARLRDGVSLAQARAEAQTLVDRQADNYGKAGRTTIRVTPLQSALVGSAGPMLFVLLGAVALLLLLACVNVASLMLARAAGRTGELAVRAALGSSRSRLVRQLLTESVALALAGAVAGALLAFGVARALLAAAPVTIVQPGAAGFDVQVFVYGVFVALLAGLGVGVVPALQASRPDLEAALREGGRSGSSSRRQTRTWNALVVCQVAVALILLAGAGLLFKSFHRLQAVALGIGIDDVLTFQVNLPAGRYERGEQRSAFHQVFHDRLSALPGVTAVGAVSRLPVTGTYHSWGTRIPGTEGWPLQPEQRVIEGRYFEAMGIPVIRGRAFGSQDGPGAERRVVVSESVAGTLFPSHDAIGQRIQVTGFQATIVGIVPDVALNARGARAAAVYHAHAQFADNRNWALTQVIAGSGDATRLEAIQRELAAVDPGLVLHNVQPLAAIVGRGQARERFSLQLIGAFAVLAMLIAGIGLYGVLAYAVTSRRQEIAVRLAVGAPVSAVRTMFVTLGGRLTMAGLALGAIAAVPLTRALESLLFDISATDPVVFAGAAFVLGLVALAAAWVPARSASRVEALEALRK